MEGPGVFKNKFGREVYGVKITYETLVAPATIRKESVVIHLPERWVKRTKVVPLTKDAQDVKLVEEKPPFAYSVA